MLEFLIEFYYLYSGFLFTSKIPVIAIHVHIYKQSLIIFGTLIATMLGNNLSPLSGFIINGLKSSGLQIDVVINPNINAPKPKPLMIIPVTYTLNQ
jgi:hypothetical protein